MVFFDWVHSARRRSPQAPGLAAMERALDGPNGRGASYLAIRRTLEASQLRMEAGQSNGAPVGRKGAAFARLDRMYEVAMLVAAACDVAGVPAPTEVTSWPDELIRLRRCRGQNADGARRLYHQPD